MDTEKIDRADAKFIDSLSTYSEKKLLGMLDLAKKNEQKLQKELQNTTKKRHFIQDAIMAKWREPSESLRQAIWEMENGQTESYESIEEFCLAMDKVRADALTDQNN